MNGVFNAFEKLSIRDKLVFLVVIVLIVCGVFALVLKTGSSGLERAEFPESSLAVIGEMQKYERISYDDLPLELYFPGSSSSIFVGGTEKMATDKGSLIEYDNDFSIVAFSVDSELKETIDNEFPVLFSSERKTHYQQRVSGDGYMNTLPLHYEGGILRLSDGPLYILSYTKEYEGFAVVTRDKGKLLQAKKLLDKVATTYGNAGTSAPVSADAGEELPAEDEVSEETEIVTSKDAMDWPDDGNKSELNTDGHSDMTVTVDRDYAHAVFVFEYMNMRSTPIEVLLEGPYGEGYVPTYCNENKDGRIIFEVDRPSMGEWVISLTDNAVYGTYNFRVMDKESYEIELSPRARE